LQNYSTSDRKLSRLSSKGENFFLFENGHLSDPSGNTAIPLATDFLIFSLVTLIKGKVTEEEFGLDLQHSNTHPTKNAQIAPRRQPSGAGSTHPPQVQEDPGLNPACTCGSRNTMEMLM
jgi:hypothetical protein